MQLQLRKVIEHYSYCLQDEIGAGYQSTVYLGVNDASGRAVALKIVDLTKIVNEVQRFLLNNEIFVLSRLRSPHILELLDVFQTASNLYLITEYCEEGDLRRLLSRKARLGESEALALLGGLLEGFKVMNSKGVVHCDIKPDNVLLADGKPKIADFGFAMTLDSPQCSQSYQAGSPIYMSPAALLSGEYSLKSDVWSLGVLYYELLIGFPP